MIDIQLNQIKSNQTKLVLEIWGMQSAPKLPLLPGPHWSGVVVPDRVLYVK